MASEKSPLIVIRSPAAIDDLHDIWQWNAARYGVSHADQYLNYLMERIAGLATTYESGKRVAQRPDLYYILIRRRRAGHGHIAVYNFDPTTVRILHIFHTAQDWQTKLTEE